MRVILADNSGFCFGVERAINKSLITIKSKEDVYSLGPLIHNKQVIESLSKQGLTTIENIDELNSGILIIRSHGVPINIYNDLKSKSIDYVDLTCPFVRNIQKIAKEHYDKGYKIIIIGNPKHPEVIGINGWCNYEADIINSKDDIEDTKKYDKICIVVQTTMNERKFEVLSKLISKNANEVLKFNTICNATKSRQKSCKEVASKVDAMIVIGGYHSSNTQKLVSISKDICKNTYHIETIDDINLKELKKYSLIGITAGASTPDWIIKEVVNHVSNIDNEMNKMMEEIEKTLVDVKKGDIIEGIVISTNKDEVMVNIGYKSDGIIKKSELSNDPNINPEDFMNENDNIEVYVLKLDDGEGNVLLSKKKVDNIKGWEKLESIYNENSLIKGKVVEIVRGGIIVLVNNIRGFVPASHISINYVENLNKYLGKEFLLKIIEFNRDKKKLVLSRKEVELLEIDKEKEILWNNLEKGMKIEGEVKRLTDFGAFVDIGGVDGLVHISELSWGRVNNPSEILNVGDKVDVIVLDFDKEKERISLGYKQTKEHPWDNVENQYSVGDIVEGNVVKLVDFGAFIELKPGLDGLVHISEISHKHIAKPSEELSKGDKVKVKVLDIDSENKRLSLSIKEAEEKENLKYKDDEDVELTVGDMIKKDEKN
ncbi:bifunctional 4-hydroxy-3-methylbut-2-enyl diphosphate reductase/30S ribosomal protein S1 [Clostridium sp. D2Q-14]|uniref:bifunctional 4-hydroxy-3-methylbut-2-enyl diphosphate reductase/30S ribosomal protein S1 n=1 Tax=Anaeromonas gelatinilytica TaxID=2683194 RepID=UPI00193B0C31|nr:bifunctional 4-hydroxy-3-methylbut-2-enyl diphosphate reductase/30S ribosomal protein S1 [Anaeromonas gelatinilytica]MBS4536256.1 bifunctional 4-hydroxy-3-methylbut-2-enyl diphosphate reductase/30S ribosomal protein S1 [Anaeromonas gelatinilytica]